MKKIISLFKRNYDGDGLVRNEIVEGAEWVVAGEGVATRKFDGTCCLFQGGRLYKRYDAKHGKTPPPDFIPAQDPDPTTGHWPGWVPARQDDPADRWHLEALQSVGADNLTEGTYELCGPKINGNPEGFDIHVLIPHGKEILDAPRDFDGLREYFRTHNNIEGIVWHHPDGRMVKIKLKDFGIKRQKVK
jgi:hypothetical protein